MPTYSTQRASRIARHLVGKADFWADDGNVVVRRDDGAFARDAGVIGAHGIVNSPPLLFFGGA